jgi:dipeptidyl aminopeptidase/acylaminoacyl peptidase
MTTPLHDLDDYLALPRVSGLAVSADGSRLVTTIAELNDNRTEYSTAIWELDPSGQAAARRLTRGASGEPSPAFTADGDLLFITSQTGSGTAEEKDRQPAALWRLPAGGGEPVEELSMPGGVTDVRTARNADATVVNAPLLLTAQDIDDDRRLRRQRADAKVSAVLHARYPVRYWDQDLGPDEPHLFEVAGRRNLAPRPGTALRNARPGAGLRDAGFDISADGRFVVTTWRVPEPEAGQHSVLVRIDVNSGKHTVIVDDPAADLEAPVISPDGAGVAFTRETMATPDRAPHVTVGYLRFGEKPVAVAEGWDRWPVSLTWSRDSASLFVTADQAGRRPVFAIDVSASTVTQLTDDEFAYTDVVAAPEGVLFALRSSYAAPPHPVRIDPGGTITVLPCIDLPALPGSLSETTATTPDGTPVRSWLVLPEATAPAPLLLWIHGGPQDSWNRWSWRWNPWLMAAHGYAVLLPDPALSTGYGQEFMQRGWGAWGDPPFHDLMAATDAACSHPRIDATRTAAMGDSFGGYMINWIAGHTDRFNALVTHAGLWAMDQLVSTTDLAYYWRREMTPRMVVGNSPHHFVDAITTPMLLIHGDKDYRVPVGEGLRLWFDLLAASGLPAGDDGSSPHRFLYFPSEHHWVVAPQHTKIWYQVVTAFLSEHVLGQPADLPELLG